ncbi:hypothetical protein EX30DRAFT_342620 [Ascodesmis nigricans]|uniref:Uncharacterized protein n=1 Tax=Ascodesmis nigricans TaxID=341454 RepID=A0A4S2MPR6_9PEZI|nr:hypothetical protein EX30DRAFT_342620 [Ascodesmis nigricans]
MMKFPLFATTLFALLPTLSLADSSRPFLLRVPKDLSSPCAGMLVRVNRDAKFSPLQIGTKEAGKPWVAIFKAGSGNTPLGEVVDAKTGDNLMLQPSHGTPWYYADVGKPGGFFDPMRMATHEGWNLTTIDTDHGRKNVLRRHTAEAQWAATPMKDGAWRIGYNGRTEGDSPNFDMEVIYI